MTFDESRLGAFHLEQEASVFSRSWFTNAHELLTITPYPNGVSFSRHLPSNFENSLDWDRAPGRPAQRYPVEAAQQVHSFTDDTPLSNRDGANPEVVERRAFDAVAATGSDALLNHDPLRMENHTARRDSDLGLHSSQFDLRLPDTRHCALPPGTYWAYRENYHRALRGHLHQLQKQGNLDQTAIVFGLTSDPFHHAERTGVVSSACMKVFEEFNPGLLLIQTRSPKLLASPELWALPRDQTVIVVPLETSLQAASDRYTPGLPPLKDRIVLIERLREDGFKVHVKVSPVLPYGDFYRDSWKFAEILARYANYVSFTSLSSFLRHPRTAPIALRQRLQIDRQIKFLEPFSYRSVYYALQSLAVHKLQFSSPFLPNLDADEQLALFEPKVREPLR